MTYEEAKKYAQERADQTGYDYGVEKSGGAFRSFMLPQKRNRQGHELRCEVVSPMRLEKCQPGHGPLAH